MPRTLLADIEELLPRVKMSVSRFNTRAQYQNLVARLHCGLQLKPPTEARIRAVMRRIELERRI